MSGAGEGPGAERSAGWIEPRRWVGLGVERADFVTGK